MTLCFATNNAHKLDEVRALLGQRFELKSLADIGCAEELPETGDTLDANARQKARYVWEKYRVACFADDTGLEVTALGGAPGVYSARYAGPARDAEANTHKLLRELAGNADRTARFRTVIAFIDANGRELTFRRHRERADHWRRRAAPAVSATTPFFSLTATTRLSLSCRWRVKNRIGHRGPRRGGAGAVAHAAC